jgi:hypothetical protein
MIGHVVELKTGLRLVLLKAGPAYLCQEVSKTPMLIGNCIEQFNTNDGPMYLGTGLFFGPIDIIKTIAQAEDVEKLSLALLYNLQIAKFFQQIISQWSTGNAPPWALESTDDLLNYLRWITGEVDYLSRSAPIPH